MSKLSERIIQKIQEDILFTLYQSSPKLLFANNVAEEIGRDNELIIKMLFQLKEKGLVKSINLSNQGKMYVKRQRWTLTDDAYSAYNNLAKP